MPDATADEITTVNADAGSNGAAAAASNSMAKSSYASVSASSTDAVNMDAASGAGNDDNSGEGDNAGQDGGVQTFTGALGGLPPPVIESPRDRPFSVKGNTFVNSGAALRRSCAIQHNACANAANGGGLAGGVGQCDAQEQDCIAAAGK